MNITEEERLKMLQDEARTNKLMFAFLPHISPTHTLTRVYCHKCKKMREVTSYCLHVSCSKCKTLLGWQSGSSVVHWNKEGTAIDGIKAEWESH